MFTKVVVLRSENPPSYHGCKGRGSEKDSTQLLRAGVLSNSLGALRHCMLGQLSRQKKADSRLDLPRGNGGPRDTRSCHSLHENNKWNLPLVVVGQLASLSSNPLEQVIDKRVHDGHGLGRHTSVRMHLFQHLEQVKTILCNSDLR